MIKESMLTAIGNDELIHEFAFAIIYRRGMYIVTAGKDEYALAQKYEELKGNMRFIIQRLQKYLI